MLCVAFSFSFFFLSLSNKNRSMHTEFHHFMFSLLNQIIKGNNSIKSSIVTRTNTEHNKNSIHNIIRCIFRGKKRSRTFASMLLVAWLSSYMRQCPGKNRYSQRASTNAYSENTNSKVLCTESRPPTNYVTPNNHCRHVLFFSFILLSLVLRHLLFSACTHEKCI